MAYSDPEKQKEYQREWRAERRAEWIEANGPCTCGSTEDLQVDHIDPKTKHPKLKKAKSTSSIWSWSKERRETELAKCQVLCKKCHRVKSVAEGSIPPITHGAISRYRAGCRCNLCRATNAAKRAATRARTGRH